MFFISLLAISAFLLALFMLAGLLLVLRVADRAREHFLRGLMFLLVGASTGTVLLSERVLRTGQQGLEVISEADMAGGVIAKFLLVVVIAASIGICFDGLITELFSQRTRKFTQDKRRANEIFPAFLYFFVAFSVVPIFFGAKFYFHVSLIYPLFIYLALFIAFGYSRVSPLIVAKQCLLAIVVGSLASALISPSLAIQPGYSSIVPGFNIRLWGITAHPNTLGSVASIGLLLEIVEPSDRKWLHRFGLLSYLTALVLSQSKTSIGSALIGLTAVISWRINASLSANSRGSGARIAIRNRFLMMCFTLSLLLGGAVMLFSDFSLLPALERRLNLNALGDISTATGRTWIWSVAVQAGLDSPLFGQGGDFWSAATRAQYGLSGASHAHNLFLQVFSRSGGFGLIALIVLVVYCVKYAIRARRVTRGGSLAFLVLFLTRAMFEVPLQPNSVLGAEFFATIAVLFYLAEKGVSLPTTDRGVSEDQRLFPFVASVRWNRTV